MRVKVIALLFFLIFLVRLSLLWNVQTSIFAIPPLLEVQLPVSSNSTVIENRSTSTAGKVDATKTVQKFRKLRNLVVFDALGTPSALPIVHYNVNAHFRIHLNQSKNTMDWECIVFVYANEQELPSTPMLDDIAKSCTITRKPGYRWSHFLMTLTPSFVQDFDYIMVILDDLLAPAVGYGAVDVSLLIHNMQNYNISSITPTVRGGSWKSIYPVGNHDPKCVREINMLETFFQIFTRQMWTNCYHPLLRADNPMANCVDLCLMHKCPSHVMAVDESMLTFHLGRSNLPYRQELLLSISPGISTELNQLLLSNAKVTRGRHKYEFNRTENINNDDLCLELNCGTRRRSRLTTDRYWKSPNPFFCSPDVNDTNQLPRWLGT